MFTKEMLDGKLHIIDAFKYWQKVFDNILFRAAFKNF